MLARCPCFYLFGGIGGVIQSLTLAQVGLDLGAVLAKPLEMSGL